MAYHERNLPHCYPPDATLFLTWCLYGCGPGQRRVERFLPDPGRAFAQADKLLDDTTCGPLWMKDSRIAAVVAGALEQGEREYALYERFAWVIMPNHVHIVIRPSQPLSVIMRWLKGSTARSANIILGRTGKKFWQCETCDHVVHNSDELNHIVKYIERNPVRAGLVHGIEDWRWSSAGRRPTLHGGDRIG